MRRAMPRWKNSASDAALMVAYSFKQRFVAPILSGAKQQTIRAHRKRHAWPEEEMQLYTGMRTKHCRLIARVTCLSVAPITIDLPDNSVTLGGETLRGWDKLDALARRDGVGDAGLLAREPC